MTSIALDYNDRSFELLSVNEINAITGGFDAGGFAGGLGAFASGGAAVLTGGAGILGGAAILGSIAVTGGLFAVAAGTALAVNAFVNG